jgi:uncharacterized protein
MARLLRRAAHERTVAALLRSNPVVALLGARQTGKTTLAREVARGWSGGVHRFDLEDPADLQRLGEPMLALRALRGLVVIDEVQLRPDLFPVLRVLADRPRTPARFLVLGSAAPELLRQTSETLAGRIAFHLLGGFDLAEVGREKAGRLWLRGGFPRSFLARSDTVSFDWRTTLVRTYIERELGQLGVGVPPATLSKFWAMLAHHHGQILNSAELARAFGVSDATVRRYLEVLVGTFLVRRLPPFFENLAKRQVKSPKVYLTDTGILHALLGIHTTLDLARHPKIGASWEGFAIAQIVDRLRARPEECFFWATHAGAELDLLVIRGRRRLGFEIKRTDAPRLTPSMRTALADLSLDELTVVHAGLHAFPMAPRVRALPLRGVLDLKPL